ncbi:MAG: DNA polymerase III subunit gamma/tau [Prevotellaceae bacterium]|jgi:DNA polymerase-3 subunit gamma/tau|nr:DNA polymerase III subunit gamma/tau [Prevotellaceae bacterium]
MEQFVVSAIKYRPLSFASVVGQSTIGATLKNAIERGHLSHAYLFCGPRGVGKTTCARIFAKTINCLSPDADREACGKCESCRSFAEGRSYSIHELDAASNNSVDDIRQLVEQVRIPPQIGKYSVYIIDEVHMLSSSAFNAFLKTLEEPPRHAIFILATTEKHKILPTILSRCQIYDFNRINVENIVAHLEDIARKEGVTAEPDALNIIARKADGAMRDALSIFDRVVSFCGNNVTYSAVIEDLNVLDYEYYFKLTEAFLKTDYREAMTIFDEILRKGFDPGHFVAGLSAHFRDLLVSKDTQTMSLLEVGSGIAERYKNQSVACPLDFLFDALNISAGCEAGYKSGGNPRLHVELALLNISRIGREKKNESSEQDAPQQTVATSAPAPAATKNREAPLPEAPKTPSLKSMLAEVKNGKNAKSEKTDAPTAKDSPQAGNASELSGELSEGRSNELSEEKLAEEWRKFAETIKTRKPRLSGRLLEYTPKLAGGGTVRYPVINEQHKNVMTEHSSDLLKHLRTTCSPTIEIEWVVQQTPVADEQPKNRLYTPKEKVDYLISLNSSVASLIKDLDLDYR